MRNITTVDFELQAHSFADKLSALFEKNLEIETLAYIDVSKIVKDFVKLLEYFEAEYVYDEDD